MKTDFKGPTDALVAITYKCNARCIMCNIWKDEPKEELKASDYLKLPKTLKDINITGGEPFLRNDIVEIIENITKNNPKVRIVISSNGFLTSKIVSDMKKIVKINPKACIAFSLDGMYNMHSKVRGIDNAYDKVINTVNALKKEGIADIRLAYTASKENISHLCKVYELSQHLNVEFTLSVVHNSDNYFSIESNQAPDIKDLEDELNYVINKEYNHLSPRRLARIYFMKGILEFIKNSKRPLKCQALEDFFYLDPQGEVYPCNIMNKSVGNLTSNNFHEIWYSNKTQKMKNFCKTCNDCWMVCTAKSSIRRELPKVALNLCTSVFPTKVKVLSN